MTRRVLLISPPWRMPDEGCLAIALLKPLLERDSIPTDTLHGTQRFPRTHTDPQLLSSYAAHLFAPLLSGGPSRDDALDALISRLANDLNLGGLVLPPPVTLLDLGRDERALRRDLLGDFERAATCVDRCVDAVGPDHDVVGFSVTFESQLPAALAIAQRLRERRPDLRLILGGAACAQRPADAIIASFEAIDAVCHSEGEHVITPLIRALRAGDDLSEVPGVAWRRGGQVVHNPSPPLLRDLDPLPFPDYHDFVEALSDSEWSALPPKLFFETSRGCWWGERTLCTFCGLNADGLPFRAKTPDRAFDEIHALYRDHPTCRRLQATDNILEMRYLRTLMPRLAAMPRAHPLRLFFEVKPNMRREHLQVLAEAGVDLVQPGIESLDDRVLTLMNKGNTALGQLQFIKWAAETGVALTYNLIVRNPHEQASWYHEMTHLIDAVDHLPPPDCVTPMWLERFSPYHSNPDQHGITCIRPRPHDPILFPQLPVPHADLTYVFDYDHPSFDDLDLIAALRAFVQRVARWQREWRPGRLSCTDVDGEITVVDHRGGFPLRLSLRGRQADLFRYLDQARPASGLQRRFPDLGEGGGEVLRAWVARRWVAQDHRGRTLVVVPTEQKTQKRTATK